MTLVRTTGAAAVLLLMGTVGPLYGQPGQQLNRQGQPREQNHPQQQYQQQQPPYRNPQQAARWQQQRQTEGAWRGNQKWQQGRARQSDREHRSWVQLGGYGGYYIPQASFGLYFGSQHHFRMQSRPVMSMGYPRFNYRGFSFMLVDPWPEYWQENWYQTDDVYVDYDNGYYLHNCSHPGIRLAITVTR